MTEFEIPAGAEAVRKGDGCSGWPMPRSLVHTMDDSTVQRVSAGMMTLDLIFFFF